MRRKDIFPVRNYLFSSSFIEGVERLDWEKCVGFLE